MALAFKGKLKNCSKCGKVFAPVRNEKLCRDCLIEEKEKETQIIQFVRDHPNITMKEVMDQTGASDKMLKRMLNEGLFANITQSGDFFYPCVNCGRPINKGTYCSDCLANLRRETKKVAEQMNIRIKEKKGMSTIQKLDAEAEHEFQREQKTYYRYGWQKG